MHCCPLRYDPLPTPTLRPIRPIVAWKDNWGPQEYENPVDSEVREKVAKIIDRPWE